ncbi:MAG: ADP-dependent glucokinase/phosphofructokinase, partial [Pseudomonadales bacterium]|nr:ADP-dependent glucokinase/phosphofructokinase [Pseudomonadales bacterium]
MTDRTAIAKAAAAGLRDFSIRVGQTPVIIGFDGFVDSIIDVVDKRIDTETYEPVHTIADFGGRISAAAGRSSNIELVTKIEKLGGNGPIMANAMARAGFDVTYIGPLGEGVIHPVFNGFAKIATVHSIADPAHTDALEFDDGKLMLGKHASLKHVNQGTIDSHLGREEYVGLIRRTKFLGMVNWTMLTRLNTIWEALIDDVLP